MASHWLETSPSSLPAALAAARRVRRAVRAQLPVLLILFPALACAGQSTTSALRPAPPDSPHLQTPVRVQPPSTRPCAAKPSDALAAAAAIGKTALLAGAGVQSALAVPPHPCASHLPIIDWYARFLNGPQVKPLTPLEKAHLAGRNLIDPFNLLTIFGEAAISVASNPDSHYGPGMPGYGRYSGVSFTQDMTGEFFGTFFIPSLAHQDPHYHRMPHASIPRRFVHAIVQVAWTQGDNGKPMVNYADLVGFAIDGEIGDLYVPGVQTDLPATAARYAIGLATAPIDNFITEFLPDVARRIHVRVVLVQRIIDQVAKSDASGSP